MYSDVFGYCAAQKVLYICEIRQIHGIYCTNRLRIFFINIDIYKRDFKHIPSYCIIILKEDIILSVGNMQTKNKKNLAFD